MSRTVAARRHLSHGHRRFRAGAALQQRLGVRVAEHRTKASACRTSKRWRAARRSSPRRIPAALKCSQTAVRPDRRARTVWDRHSRAARRCKPPGATLQAAGRRAREAVVIRDHGRALRSAPAPAHSFRCATNRHSLARSFSPTALQPAEWDDEPQLPRERWGWLEVFVLIQVLWGVLLFVPGSQAYRTYIRAFPYVSSFVALVACARSIGADTAGPGARWILLSLMLLVASLMHPATWMMSGLAQIMFQLALAAPIFWAVRVWITPERLERLIVLVFAAHFLSAGLGLLQVYYPDTFLPPEFSALGMKLNPEFVHELSYLGTDDRLIVRPPGLSDMPGGAAISGVIAALLGVRSGHAFEDPGREPGVLPRGRSRGDHHRLSHAGPVGVVDARHLHAGGRVCQPSAGEGDAGRLARDARHGPRRRVVRVGGHPRRRRRVPAVPGHLRARASSKRTRKIEDSSSITRSTSSSSNIRSAPASAAGG